MTSKMSGIDKTQARKVWLKDVQKYFGLKNLDVDFTYTGVCLFNMSLFAGAFKISGNLAFS